jgi:uncharacterized protein (DUF1684 family)
VDNSDPEAITGSAPTWLDLHDWRRRVAALYRTREQAWRAGQDRVAVWRQWRAGKDALFAQHPQSPLTLAQRRGFVGLPYFPYDPACCVEAWLIPEPDAEPAALDTGGPPGMIFRRAARARFQVGETPLELVVYWIDVYGGGLFLPFRDATCPTERYGGGRFLVDPVNGRDFLALAAAGGVGYAGGRVLLDFNYAYNPSCAYDARWVCPLAPPENRLPVAIRAGERKFLDLESET